MGINELILKRFNFIMPMVYDDAISYQELLYKIGNKQDEIIDQVNANSEAIEEIQDSGVSVTVDSTLSDTSTNPVQNKVITEALRMIDRTIIHAFDSSEMINRNGYYLNAMCYAESRGTFYLGFKPSDNVIETYNGEAVICEVDANFNVLNTGVSVDYGKLNDLCFANGKLYVAPAYSTYSQYHYRVIEVDPDTLNIVGVHYPVPSASPVSICYDSASSKFYLSMAIAGGSNDQYTYSCDADFTNPARLTNTYWLDKNNLVLQSAEFVGNKEVQLANSKNPTGYIYFRTYFEGNQFCDMMPALTINNSVEEPEGICKVGNDIYIATINNTTAVRIYKISPLCDVYKRFIAMPETLSAGIPIVANSDLNDLYDVGVYYAKMTATAVTLSNCPVSKAFRMTVENSRGVDGGDTIYRMQTIISVTDEKIYKRILSVTNDVVTASAWYTLASSANATTTTAGLMSATDKTNLDTLYADYLSASTALG